MKYRLKDQEFQKKLDEISDGDFSRCLNNTFYGRIIKIRPFTEIHFGQIVVEDGTLFHRFTARVREDEIEEIRQYDPHRWNRFPEVTPPQGAMMRIKYHDVTSEDRKVERGFAIFDCGQWVIDSAGYPKFPNNPQNYVIWFRPWIGPDEEDSK